MWNLTNQRRSEERDWTSAQETLETGSGRGAHLANGGNAWEWRLVRMYSCAGREELGNPPFLQCCHQAGRAEPEGAGLLVWLPVGVEQEAGAERVAEASAAAAAAAGRRMVGAVRSGVSVGWRCPCGPCFVGW